MTTHSSILAWEISWTKEPGGLQSMAGGGGGVTKESDTTQRLKKQRYYGYYNYSTIYTFLAYTGLSTWLTGLGDTRLRISMTKLQWCLEQYKPSSTVTSSTCM